MKVRIFALFVTVLFPLLTLANGELPKPLLTGLKNPESVAVGGDGRIYVSVIGEFNKDGDGSIVVVQDGKAVPFAQGLNDPKGLIAFQGQLYVTDKTRVLRISKSGKVSVFADKKAFPKEPLFLNDITLDQKTGMIYVSDSGDLNGKEGKVFRIAKNGKVSLVLDSTSTPSLKAPNGLLSAEHEHLFMLDFGSGELHRINLKTKKLTKLASELGGADGIIYDHYGRLYLSDWKNGKVFVIPRPGEKPILITDKFKAAADICLSADGRSILVPDMNAGTLTALPAQVPGQPLDESPLPVKAEIAFPNIQWTGWSAELPSGKIAAQRPIVLTHAGDGSDRIFMATQRGVIHTFPNNPQVKKSQIFLDIQDRVIYKDNQNEEGFLGLAFHPNYKKTGEFFVYYTTKKASHTSVVSRFRVSKEDPNRADPSSEEEILRVPQPFWNHNGGTIAFGTDGKLYIALGDGGAANDPFNNGQKLSTWLGAILRIDIDNKDKGLNYAIPKDNPFVNRKGAKPEIWAYGLRNVWRMAFDHKTGDCWVGEVGQNVWEEINIVTSGGNYGWNLRESFHPFGAKGVGPRKDLIDPIWEYHHDLGKSVTGGHVYRGKKIAELQGMYLYADYVTGLVWGLKYDKSKNKVVANRRIDSPKIPILSFGEDEKGESYFLTTSTTGRGIYRLVGK